MMLYRGWSYQDILAVAALEKQCFAGESWNYQMFASSFERDGFFGELCETDETAPEQAVEKEKADGESERRKLIAYGCVQCVFETADLMSIAVAKEYRQRGVGRTMLRRLLRGAARRGAKKMFLEVRASNVAAQALYVSEGFSVLSMRKKYYPDGEDALVMVKDL